MVSPPPTPCHKLHLHCGPLTLHALHFLLLTVRHCWMRQGAWCFATRGQAATRAWEAEGGASLPLGLHLRAPPPSHPAPRHAPCARHHALVKETLLLRGLVVEERTALLLCSLPPLELQLHLQAPPPQLLRRVCEVDGYTLLHKCDVGEGRVEEEPHHQVGLCPHLLWGKGRGRVHL